MEEEKKNNNKQVMHIVSLVFGIISILTCFFWYLSLPAGIIAIVCGTISAKKTGSRIAKAGLITGIIGLSLLAFCYISMLLIMLMANL